jgi:DNA-directed RNA polymerase specialized sigma24 family protein
MADEFYDHPEVRSAVRRVLYSKGIRNEHDLDDGVQQVIADCIAQDRKLGRTPKDVAQAKVWAIAAAEKDAIDAIRKRVSQGKTHQGPTDTPDDHAKEAAAFLDPMVREPLEEIVNEKLTPEQRRKYIDMGSGVSQKQLAKEAGVPTDVYRKQTQRERTTVMKALRRAGLPLTIAAVMVGALLLGVNAFRDKGDVTKTPKEHAAEQRHFAAEKCKARDWVECVKALDRAKDADPEGETSDEVKAMREAIEKGRGGAGGR